MKIDLVKCNMAGKCCDLECPHRDKHKGPCNYCCGFFTAKCVPVARGRAKC
jgi:hypothetical protein